MIVLRKLTIWVFMWQILLCLGGER